MTVKPLNSWLWDSITAFRNQSIKNKLLSALVVVVVVFYSMYSGKGVLLVQDYVLNRPDLVAELRPEVVAAQSIKLIDEDGQELARLQSVDGRVQFAILHPPMHWWLDELPLGGSR